MYPPGPHRRRRAQLVLCSISGTLVRLNGSGWRAALPDKPTVRPYVLHIGGGRCKVFPQQISFESIMYFVWKAVLCAARLRGIAEAVLVGWASIPNGLCTSCRAQEVSAEEMQREFVAAAEAVDAVLGPRMQARRQAADAGPAAASSDGQYGHGGRDHFR